MNESISKQKGKPQTKINPKIFEVLRKALGEFEIIM